METKISQNRMLVKICCVIASFILWLYVFNVENPVRERRVVVPVKITNKSVLTQSNLVPVEDKNYEISLDVKGNASDVFSIKPQDFELECNLSSYVMKKGENNIPVKIKKSPNNINIVNGENLWIAINLDSIVTKKVPINLIIDGQNKSNLNLVNPTLNVKQAEISGSSIAVNSVKSIIARYNIKDISKNVKVKVALQAQDVSGNIVKSLNINPRYVEINISVRNMKSVPINIKTIGNITNGLTIKSIISYPDKVYISGNQKDISSVNSLDTEPLYLNKISDDGNFDVKLVLPNGVKLIDSSRYVTLNIKLTRSINKNEISQKSFNIKINIKNLDNNYNAQLENNTASIVVSGNNNVLENLNKDNINCFVDLTSANEGQKDFPLSVIVPQGLFLISKNPQNIQVIVTKKSVEGEDVNKN